MAVSSASVVVTVARPSLRSRGRPSERPASSSMKKTLPVGVAPAGASLPLRVAVSVSGEPATSVGALV